MTRQTFAFNTAAPVQEQPNAQGNGRGAQVSGGNSQGGVVTSGGQTNAGPVGAQLGQFFQDAMAPWVKRKQEQRFTEGFAAAQSGIALNELSHPDNPVNKIFGPSGYEQGAQMYAASTAVSTWQRNQVNDMDNLRTLEPADLAKHIGETSRAMMTGDPFADQMIQKGLFDATGPLLNTVAKERDGWQQARAVSSMTGAIVSQGSAMQALIGKQLTYTSGSPDEVAGNTAIMGALDGLAGILGKPIGMHDESYRATLVGAVRANAIAGNGQVISYMKAKGFWGLMAPDEQDKMNLLFEKEGLKTNADMSGREDFAERLSLHDRKLQHGDFSAEEGTADLSAINEDIKQATGFDIDLFDAKDLRAEYHSLTSALIAADNKRRDRLYELKLRNDDWAHDAEVKRADEAAKVGLATMAWTAGNPVQAIMGGAESYLIEAQANNAWMTGDNKNIIRTFNLGYVSDAVKKAATSQVEASVGEQYNANFERTYKQWATLYQQKPAAALAYYGAYHVVMQRYDSLVKGHTDPITAFSKTFGDASQYGSADVGPERKREYDKNIDDALGHQESWLPGWAGGDTPLGENGRTVFKQAARRYVYSAGTNAAQGTGSLLGEFAEASQASGQLERFGQFAVSNKAGTRPIATLLGLQARDTTVVFRNVYNKHMALSGAAADTDPKSLIRYDDNGHPAFVAVVEGRDGNSKRVLIQYSELATEAHRYVSTKVARTGQATIHKQFNAVDAYRDVPGESGWARLKRINREVAAGSDPVRR